MENILVCSYNEFDNLAHKVRGNKALQPLNFIENDLLQENNINCVNPAFAQLREINMPTYVVSLFMMVLF